VRLATAAALAWLVLENNVVSAQNFDAVMNLVLGHEGGFTNDRRDPGNWTGGIVGRGTLKGTKFGIAANTFPNEDIRNLTRDRAIALYKRHYWDAIRADELPAGVDYCLYDFSINSGAARAVKHLQAAVGVLQDGKVGPVTLAAVAKADPAELVRKVCASRLRFMRALPTWPTFKNGWYARVTSVEKVGVAMASRGSSSAPKPAHKRTNPPPKPAAPRPAPQPAPAGFFARLARWFGGRK
jgi:lysozyme family protein